MSSLDTHRRRCRCLDGFTLLEILIVMAIVAVLAAVAMPKVGEAIAQARESAALQHIKAIHSAQATYFSRQGRFAATLAELGPPPAGAGLVPGELARGERLGYRFELAAAGLDDYQLTAQPLAASSSLLPGVAAPRRSFFSDASLLIRVAQSGQPLASAESPELGAAAAPRR